MPTLKDALDLIGKLTKTEQESLKMILLRPSPTMTTSKSITNQELSNRPAIPLLV